MPVQAARPCQLASSVSASACPAAGHQGTGDDSAYQAILHMLQEWTLLVDTPEIEQMKCVQLMFIPETSSHFHVLQEWTPLVDTPKTEWMESVQLVFDYFCERTPRSFVEARETSVVWNYKYADNEFGRLQVSRGTVPVTLPGNTAGHTHAEH